MNFFGKRYLNRTVSKMSRKPKNAQNASLINYLSTLDRDVFDISINYTIHTLFQINKTLELSQFLNLGAVVQITVLYQKSFLKHKQLQKIRKKIQNS